MTKGSTSHRSTDDERGGVHRLFTTSPNGNGASPQNHPTVTLRDLIAVVYRYGLPANEHVILDAVSTGELPVVSRDPLRFTERDANVFLSRLVEDASW